MLTDEEKIQRAKEIYYRRKGISFRGEEKKKKKKHNKLLFLLLVIIATSVYLYQNQSTYFTPENQNKIKEFLNTKINLKELIKINNQTQNIPETQPEKKTTNTQETPSESQNSNTSETQTEKSNTPEAIEEKKPQYSIIWPKQGTITSNFGMRESTDTRVGKNHTGIDIAGEEGEEIASAITGKVTLVSEEGDLGKHIKIENDEYETVYAHCSQIYVEPETQVNQGDIIAAVGSTGNSTGNHLHFEVIKAGEYIDPLTVIEK